MRKDGVPAEAARPRIPRCLLRLLALLLAAFALLAFLLVAAWRRNARPL